MKEKAKGNPRRRLFWLLGAVVFLLGGYLSLPYAQNAIVAWWEDDPFTPMCDVPNLRLYLDFVNEATSNGNTEGFPFYDVGARTSSLIAVGHVWGTGPSFSPNQRWFMVRFFSNEFPATAGFYVYDIESNSELLFAYSNKDSFWLSDSRLVYKPMDSEYWFIFNPENGAMERIPESNQHSLLLQWEAPTLDSGYFISFESVNSVAEYVLYSHDLQRRILQSIPSNWNDWNGIDTGTVSPNRRYYSYWISIDNSDYTGTWFIDLENTSAQSIRISVESVYSKVWSPDSRYLALITHSGTIEVFDTEQERFISHYEIPDRRIVRMDWLENGIWIVAEPLLSNETQPDTLYWGQFNGTDFEVEALMNEYLSMAYNEIKISDSTAAFTQFSHQIGDGLPHVQDFYTLFLLNNDGEIVWTVENLADNFIEQTPDKRYLSYVGVNLWIYLLDLETYRSCRVIENHNYNNTYNTYSYQWLTLPQP